MHFDLQEMSEKQQRTSTEAKPRPLHFRRFIPDGVASVFFFLFIFYTYIDHVMYIFIISFFKEWKYLFQRPYFLTFYSLALLFVCCTRKASALAAMD